MANKGMVYLVGAGPGDPQLITLKGLECIKKADVLVYDRLADSSLLSWAKDDAELINVGKSPDNHIKKQPEINKLLIDKALEGKTVTRLKGGDPFVFGRGGEEAQSLSANGIPFEIVPGVTSAIAVPAYAGIPVTHRGISSSFKVITGNEDPDKGQSQLNWANLAAETGTLIFLMGMGNFKQISSKLIKQGMKGCTPAAVIQWGATSKQKVLTADLQDISNLAETKGFTNPAVIVIGDVVNLRSQINWYENKPLFGKRILVTRACGQAGEFGRIIKDLGGDPVEMPVIRIEEPLDFGPMDRALNNIEKYRWIIFTSVNGVKGFWKRLIKLGIDIRNLKGINICAIGPATRDCLESLGLRVDFVPSEYRGEEIAKGLRGKINKGDAILLPRADIARKALAELLAAEGAEVEEVVAYRTVGEPVNGAKVRRLLLEGHIDVITFTSSSTVREFANLAGKDVATLTKGIKIACIGPLTAETARESGLTADIVATEYTIKGLTDAILKYFKGVSLDG